MTVHSAAETYGKTASDARYHAAEQCTQQQVGPCKGGGYAHINGQNVRYQPRGHRIDRNGVDSAYREPQSLLFQSVQKKRNVQEYQEYRKAEKMRSDLSQKHGSSRYSAVVELYGHEENGNAESVDDTCGGEHDNIYGLDLL